VKKSFNIQEHFALQVQTLWNEAHAALLIKSFPKTPRKRFEGSWFGGAHNCKTEQNKLRSFIDRCVVQVENGKEKSIVRSMMGAISFGLFMVPGHYSS
jgi:hypothetical protein